MLSKGPFWRKPWISSVFAQLKNSELTKRLLSYQRLDVQPKFLKIAGMYVLKHVLAQWLDRKLSRHIFPVNEEKIAEQY